MRRAARKWLLLAENGRMYMSRERNEIGRIVMKNVRSALEVAVSGITTSAPMLKCGRERRQCASRAEAAMQ